MKLLLQKKDLDELILNLLEINLINDNKKITNYYYDIYLYIIKSNLIDKKLKEILLLHNKSQFFKAYELLLLQSDISNSFYEKLCGYLLYLEFLHLNNIKIYLRKLFNNEENQNLNQKEINTNKSFKNGVDSYFSDNYNYNCNINLNLYFENFDICFFKERQRIIKFFILIWINLIY